MSKEAPLINRINSKYILKSILSLAYSDIKSVFKLAAYNKNLLKRLDLNIKDYYQYNIKLISKKINKQLWAVIMDLICVIIIFILFLVYAILLLKNGSFNDEILKEGYNVEKKNFVDFMDKYLLVAYLVFIILRFLLVTLLYIKEKIPIKVKIKIIIICLLFLIDLTHYILLIFKYDYTKNLIKKELLEKLKEPDSEDHDEYEKWYKNDREEYLKYSKILWFYNFDIALIVILPMYIFFVLIAMVIISLDLYQNRPFITFLNQINRININDFELPEGFNELNEKDKNKLIFKKGNMEKYSYYLNWEQRLLIRKINDIRNQKNLHILEYYETEKLPDFIINKKTLLILFPNENIYKLSTNLYIFKYPENEFQNHLNNREILNIITIDFLDRISILKQNDIEFIIIYNDNINNNRLNKHINESKFSNGIESSKINNVNSRDELNDQILNLNKREEGKERKKSN